jgi:hypothetical protein
MCVPGTNFNVAEQTIGHLKLIRCEVYFCDQVSVCHQKTNTYTAVHLCIFKVRYTKKPNKAVGTLCVIGTYIIVAVQTLGYIK